MSANERLTVEGSLGAVPSIHEPKGAERSPRLSETGLQSHALLKTLVENAPIGVAFFDPEFRYLVINKNLALQNGRPPEEHIGRTPAEVVPHYWRLLESPMRRALAGEAVENIEVQAESAVRPGELTDFRASFYPVRVGSDEIMGVGAIVNDVTAQKRAEEALREGHRRKDEFIAMLAHELRNPLAPIKSAVELLRTNGPPEEKHLRDIIERQVEQLSRLVDDLLDVTRVSRGWLSLHREPVDVATIVTRAVEACRPLIEANDHTLCVVPARAPAYVNGDAARLTQVVSNLLNNAAKYTAPGGTIRVEIDTGSPSEVILRVHDNGCGIDESDLPHIFELFYQVHPAIDRSEGGLGIGLSLVRTLVRMHGGSVSVESEGAGRGCLFIVSLPRIEAEPERTTLVSPAPKSNRLRVLVVDDNVDAADTMSMLIEAMGHEVQMAYDGESALRLAVERAPDVVLLDIGLPRMDGYEVCKKLKDAGLERTRLVALTGFGQVGDRKKALDAGFDAHLVKPASLEAIEELLRPS